MGQVAERAQEHPATSCSQPLFEVGFALLSYHFRVRTSLRPVAELVERIFGGFRAEVDDTVPIYSLDEQPSARRPFELRLDGENLMRSAKPDRVFYHLTWHAMREATAGDDHLLVHAGVVAREGEAILLPADSGSGKTTLVAGLVRAGFDYLSDEIAAIDPTTLEVAPFPLSLSVKPGSMDLLADVLPDLSDDVGRFLEGRMPVRPDDIRPEAVGPVSRVRYVISPRYEAGSRTTLEPCSRGQGLADLGRNVFNFPSFGSRGLYVLADVVREADCYRLRVGDLDEAVDVISRLAGGHPRRPSGPSSPAETEGELVAIPDRFVVAPARGRLQPEPLVAGQVIEPGTVIGRIRNGREEHPVVAQITASFGSWLASEGERVLPGKLLARLDGATS